MYLQSRCRKKVLIKMGFQVHEDSNDEVNPGPDGNPQYYAPDPDPSLPAPKTPLTFDPHSLPSNGKPLPPDLESPHQPPLTSQELYHLLHLYPQKTTPDLHTLQVTFESTLFHILN